EGENEPLINKYNNISITEDFFSRFVPKIPRIQKTREITNNLNSGEQIEDAFSILNKIDKEELLIINQLSQYCQSFNEQRRIETELSNGNNKASSSSQYKNQSLDPIDLDQIQSNLISKSYGKSVPNNNTLDILKFKLYQQELEKKKKDKSVYTSLLNEYDATADNNNHSQYLTNGDISKYGVSTDHSYSITVNEEQDQGGPSIHNQEASNTNSVPSVYNKPPLYSTSLKYNPNRHSSDLTNANNKMSINTSLTKDSPILSDANCSNKENYNTPISSNNNDHTPDIENIRSPISNDGSGITSFSSPSAILSSPAGTKLFKDISIIVPKTVDDSMMLDNQLESKPPSHQNTNHSFDLDSSIPVASSAPLTPLTALHTLHDNTTNNNNTIQPNQSFIDLSINNNIANAIDESESEEEEEEEEFSINYGHSIIGHRRRSTDYSNKRRSKNSFSSSSISKNIVPSSLFSSSLPPINRPKRVQSLKRKLTDIPEKKTMAKAQDYIALSQRSFPVRANFIPDETYGDEIKLNTGDLVVIKDVYLDSWANGINIMTNSSGVFPLCYLNTDEPQAKAKTKRFNKIVNEN
ncbi:hypothetical protein PIROE2DRAFT_16038, partial [Piromyces sp. E2]